MGPANHTISPYADDSVMPDLAVEDADLVIEEPDPAVEDEEPAQVGLAGWLLDSGLIAYPQVLPLGMNCPRIVNVRSHGTLEHRIAVKSAAVLTDLRQPRPHRLDRRVDRDSSCGPKRMFGDQLVTRQRGKNFIGVCAPGIHPRPYLGPVEPNQSDGGHQPAEHRSLLTHLSRL